MKFRPEAEVWPLMSDDQLKALAEDIDRRGQLNPIYLYEGDILDGRNRWLAITRYCTKTKPKFDEAITDSPIGFVVSLNEKRRHLNDSQRAWAAAKALPFYKAEAKKRQGQRTDLLPTSASIEAEVKSEPRRATADAAGAFDTSDGAVQRALRVRAKGSKKLKDTVEAGQLSLSKAEEIVKHYPDKRRQDDQVARVAASRMVARVQGLTGEYEWYTPRKYLDAAVTVMGTIDLDPASSNRAQEHVKAERFYTLDIDGLRQQWFGRVFLNPPYAMPYIKDFVNKMVSSYTDGDIDEGILLTNNATDTEWFHTAAKVCAGVCFTRGRISFLEASDGELVTKTSPTHGQAFFYFGANLTRFREVFAEFGTVVIPMALAEFRGDSVYVDDWTPAGGA